MRSRYRWRAAALASALALGGCTGGGSGAGTPEVGLDRETSGARVPDGPGGGPGARTLRPAWRTELDGVPPGPLAAEPVAGQLAVVSARGVDVLDARTGARRWHYYEKDRGVTDYAVTFDTIVVTTVALEGDGTPEVGEDAARRTVGLDATSGRTRWTEEGPVPLLPGIRSDYRPTGSPNAGTVTFEEDGGRTLVGRAARTGRERWRWTVPDGPGCDAALARSSTDGSLLVPEVSCPDGRRHLYALDPSDGRVRWDRPIAGPAAGRPAPAVATRRGITMINERDRGFTLLRGDGRELLGPSPRRRACAGSEFAVAEGRVVVTFGEDPGAPGAAAETGFVDARTGAVRGRAAGQCHGGLVAAGGTVYGTRAGDAAGAGGGYGVHGAGGRNLDAGLAVDGLDVIDPRSARVTLVPLPARGSTLRPQGTSVLGDPPVVGAGQVHTLEPVRGGLRVAAFAPAGGARPVELAGVDPGDWPDVCALLAGTAGLGRPEPVPDDPLRIGDVRIDGWSCRAGGHRIRIGWVAPTARAAAAIMERGPEARPVAGLGDEAYIIGSLLAVRAGRSIVIAEDPPRTLRPGGAVHDAVRVLARALGGR